MLQLHTITKSLPVEERFRLKDQVRRSSKSVPANMAEGCNSYYYNEKIKGYRHARKESGETQNHIREMQRKNYISNRESEAIIYEYEEVIRGLNGLVRYYSKKRDESKLRGQHRN
ncbi:MAG: four helix bundle protein [Candidatus Margulisbacteria bacterium]|nr:four helix bundle protein [Candidatus Margulisiibacteriota bacterium]